MNISKKIGIETAQLQKRLAALSSVNVTRLEKEREKLVRRISAIDREFARIESLLGASSRGRIGSAVAKERTKRKRVSSAAITKAVLDALAASKKGLSQIELARVTKLNYQSLVGWLKRSADKVRSEGKRKEKRYFPK